MGESRPKAQSRSSDSKLFEAYLACERPLKKKKWTGTLEKGFNVVMDEV